MNKETYKALKKIIDAIREQRHIAVDTNDIEQVESWIDEVAKEYEEERSCVKCGKTSDLIEEEDMCYTCAKERGRV